ncbi:excalibur calcium-binding domain-containing protein [Kitasatospora cineracea]|uniref:excalibur calcium-binding domain-containing protein n=1 Tax=Kitasatospora cineracea TaxID=88074 RepID=UPI0037929A80
MAGVMAGRSKRLHRGVKVLLVVWCAVMSVFWLAAVFEPDRKDAAPAPAATAASPSPVASDSPTPEPTPTPTPSPTPTPEPTPSPTPTPPPTPTPTPAPETPEPVQTESEPEPARTTEQAAAYYKNCTEAKAAGAAPLHRGEPGHRSALDRDGDGIACEK